MIDPRRSSRVLLLLVLCLAGALSLPAPSPAQGTGSLPPDLAALIDEALKANPEIRQMRASAQGLQGDDQLRRGPGRPGGRLRPSTNLPTDTWSFNTDPMTQKMLELSQKLPFPGKRPPALRSGRGAKNRADGFFYQDQVNEVRAKVIQGYWGLSLAYADYDITQKDKELWEQVVQVAETRYGVGQGMQADVLPWSWAATWTVSSSGSSVRNPCAPS